ncbi:hypothetical protein A2U10_07050 [Fusobacterium necrophorum subsp. funduliforme]|jgi:hypothetical protein|uniref:hypothetical protein n=1 Tax=Fusobacterium necrophorum TaxID=859 RepID=UPI000786893E|nr:hypothetical protein [Fusobacterium necrophorum]KYM38483.1 hypothetical protein A2U10_07050 [Fusobacterium necrophorum subsp. funduliforme]
MKKSKLQKLFYIIAIIGFVVMGITFIYSMLDIPFPFVLKTIMLILAGISGIGYFIFFEEMK